MADSVQPDHEPQPKNPFEVRGVADSYDLGRARKDQAFKLLEKDGLVYPATFGSSGGDKFLRLLEMVRENQEALDSFLEVGCGTGAFFEVLRANHFMQPYTGVDGSTEHIRRAIGNYPEANFLVGDVCSLALPDRTFSFVFENNVFPFLLYPERAVREMVRVSKRLVYFRAHATQLECGLYAWQPLYTMATAESAANGAVQYVLPETLDEALRPRCVMPKVMRQMPDGRIKIAVAKSKKKFIGQAALDALIAELGVEVLDRRVSKTAAYGAIMTESLVANNSLEAIRAASDSCLITEEDVLMEIQAMDMEFLLAI
ncbi:MAG: class I SAM-dependent methyltransferase [Kiritimatiellae bacterium]|nr:class I SAM-dependent methyltransferase [Kiritimatiellia bacterium]MDD4734613.1 class I SAM-dependent methyltransferase [Kiritimatiellia bacterium]